MKEEKCRLFVDSPFKQSLVMHTYPSFMPRAQYMRSVDTIITSFVCLRSNMHESLVHERRKEKRGQACTICPPTHRDKVWRERERVAKSIDASHETAAA